MGWGGSIRNARTRGQNRLDTEVLADSRGLRWDRALSACLPETLALVNLRIHEWMSVSQARPSAPERGCRPRRWYVRPAPERPCPC